MGNSIIVTGLVLSTMPIAEYDKRVVLLTKELGKITAFAKGSRKPKSTLLAATNPFAFGEFELYEGRTSYNIKKASISNYFRTLTTDINIAYTGFYMLEFAEYFCQENNDEKEMLKLIYQSLRALESSKFSYRLVKLVFELKAMTINGEGPSVFSCMHCHKTENLYYFSVKRGGIFCSNCKSGQKTKHIQDSTRYTMQHIISSSIEKLYTFQVSEEVLSELEEIMSDYITTYVKHAFNSSQYIL